MRMILLDRAIWRKADLATGIGAITVLALAIFAVTLFSIAVPKAIAQSFFLIAIAGGLCTATGIRSGSLLSIAAIFVYQGAVTITATGSGLVSLLATLAAVVSLAFAYKYTRNLASHMLWPVLVLLAPLLTLPDAIHGSALAWRNHAWVEALAAGLIWLSIYAFTPTGIPKSHALELERKA